MTDARMLASSELSLELLEWLQAREPDRALQAAALAIALGLRCAQTALPSAAAAYFARMLEFVATGESEARDEMLRLLAAEDP